MSKKKEQKSKEHVSSLSYFSPKMIGYLADEVAQTVAKNLPSILATRRKSRNVKIKKLEHALFLDTSAIIDGRFFSITNTGLISGEVVILESILGELKRIADSQDAVKRERGRNGLNFLEKLRKTNSIKVVLLSQEESKKAIRSEVKEVDEQLIKVTQFHKGKIITCDYSLEKKATIQGVTAINVNVLANGLKIRAVPGEALHIKLLHQGKDVSQGVGYLDDGTMIVVEQGSDSVGKTVDVVVARVIQTAAGRILFAKKI